MIHIMQINHFSKEDSASLCTLLSASHTIVHQHFEHLIAIENTSSTYFVFLPYDTFTPHFTPTRIALKKDNYEIYI